MSYEEPVKPFSGSRKESYVVAFDVIFSPYRTLTTGVFNNDITYIVQPWLSTLNALSKPLWLHFFAFQIPPPPGTLTFNLE